MNFVEIETKYNASNISFEVFEKFCKSRLPESNLFASGYDHFYDKASDSSSFCRHRVGPDSNQLTFKRKTTTSNNFVRTEHNIDLAPGVSKEQVEALCSEFGYKYNTSIFKTCFVYKYIWYVLSYYICYDLDMVERGRFVEIEMREDHKWANEDEAWSSLVVLEKLCKSLGLTPKSRIRKSLFELYREDNK